MAKAVFTSAQHTRLLVGVAQAASEIQALARMVSDAQGDDADALASAIEALAGRAGWFAEIVAHECHGGLTALDACHWLMPAACIPRAGGLPGAAPGADGH